MSSSNRDNFNPSTRKIMAERVGWKCSFPSCGINTVGPNSDSNTKSINNGIAAHICAAAPNGSRYNKDMSRNERRDISNGIWLCRHHANLIDADDSEYSPETLRAWKMAAENRAAESLRVPTNEGIPDESTLLQLGSGIVFHATWEQVNHRSWSFVLIQPETGSLETLRYYVLSLDSLTESEAYVVIESQGDARRVNNISLRKSQSSQQVLEVCVQNRLPPTDPNKFGSNLKLGNDGDLCIEGGNLALVRGVESAKQQIMCAMGVAKGEIIGSEEVGSLASVYFAKYGDDLGLLSRLIKLELIRLSLIPVSRQFEKNEPKPSLHFVKRFVNVNIASRELSHGRLSAAVDLEWGNGEYWSGDVPIFVSQ